MRWSPEVTIFFYGFLLLLVFFVGFFFYHAQRQRHCSEQCTVLVWTTHLGNSAVGFIMAGLDIGICKNSFVLLQWLTTALNRVPKISSVWWCARSNGGQQTPAKAVPKGFLTQQHHLALCKNDNENRKE